MLTRWKPRTFEFRVYYEYWQHIASDERYETYQNKGSDNVFFYCENNLQLSLQKMGWKLGENTEL